MKKKLAQEKAIKKIEKLRRNYFLKMGKLRKKQTKILSDYSEELDKLEVKKVKEKIKSKQGNAL